MTKKQRQCLDFIEAFIKDNGYSPSVTEISHAMGIKGRAAVSAIIHHLEGAGHITRSPRRARSIKLIRSPWEQIGKVAERFLNSIDPKNITEDIDGSGEGTVTIVVDAKTFGDLDVAVAEQRAGR